MTQHPAVATNRYNCHLPAGGKGRYKAGMEAGRGHADFQVVAMA